jgi:S1-C subfamily serine protease
MRGSRLPCKICGMVISVCAIGNTVFAQTPRKVTGVPPSNAVETINKVRNGVIQIFGWQKSTQNPPIPLPPVARGSGFIVSSDGYVITNYHVVDCDCGGKYGIGFPIPPIQREHLHMLLSTSIINAQVVDADAENDLALLKFDPDALLAPAVSTENPATNVYLRWSQIRLGSQIPDEGTDILVSGFPLTSRTPVTQKGIVASKVFRSVLSAHPENMSEDDLDLVYLDIELNHGNSGGPVYLLSGQVVGVAEGYIGAPAESSVTKQPVQITNPGVSGGQESVTYNSGISFMIPAKYVVALLEKNHVKYLN